MLNCCVTDTKDAPLASRISTILAKSVSERTLLPEKLKAQADRGFESRSLRQGVCSHRCRSSHKAMGGMPSRRVLGFESLGVVDERSDDRVGGCSGLKWAGLKGDSVRAPRYNPRGILLSGVIH